MAFEDGEQRFDAALPTEDPSSFQGGTSTKSTKRRNSMGSWIDPHARRSGGKNNPEKNA